jgi:dTDP-glucose 4,6-dehydratase
MRVLITGGAGFIGSHFTKMILAEQEISSIVVMDSLTYAGNLKNIDSTLLDERVTFLHQSITESWTGISALENIDIVINFAAESHVDRSIENSLNFIATNVLGVDNLLRMSLSTGVKKFLQVSTDEVYGSINSGSWDEYSPLQPNSPYSASKASADLLVLAYFKTYGLNVNITRCSNNYGTHQYPEKFIPVVINKLLSGEKVPVYGDGLNTRDWLSVIDHCDAIKKVAFHGQPGEVYNIGGGIELTNLHLVELIAKTIGLSENVIEFVADRKGHDFRYSVNYEKISKELGYKPKVNLSRDIAEIIQWYKLNSTWWKVTS